MRRWFFIISLFALCLGYNASIEAQAPSTQGKDFWLTFLNNYGNVSDLKLIVTGQRMCTGRVSNPNTGWTTTFNVSPGVVTNVSIPAAQAYTSYAGTHARGLHVTTTDTVSLYASNYYPASFDVTNILPTSALRDEYIVQTYFNLGAPSEFIIVATQDNTLIDIEPTSTPLDRSNARPYVITLNKGQTYQTGSLENGGLAGTRITAHDCKPIAVFAGNSVTQVPENVCCGDHLVEQLMPVSFHGRKFVVTSSSMRDEDRVLITASDNNCIVKINGVYATTLSAGQTYEYTLRSSVGVIFVETSQPAQVFLYFTGADMQFSSIGDPSMVLISPIEQQMSKVTFGTFTTEYTTNHYVNVVTTTSDVSGMTLNGVNVASYFRSVPSNTTYSYARIPISYGSHTLENTKGGFVAHVYGLGEYESYSYSVGSNAVDLGLQLYVNNTPVDAVSIPVESCIGRRVDMRAASDYSISSIRWFYGDGSSGQGLSSTHTYTVSGSFNIRAILAISEARCDVTRYDTLLANIKILPNSSGSTSKTLCDGQSFRWNNSDYEGTGFYSKTMRAANGCDSTDRLNLISYPTYNNTITRAITYREVPYVFNGRAYSSSIDTTLRYTSIHGCDSIIHFNLTIDVNNAVTIDTSVCENSLPITWRGYVFSNADSRSFTLRNSMGGDSVVTLRLSVLRNSRYERHDTVVENNLPVAFAGLTFRQKQHDTILRRTNTVGCDSTITYSLHVWKNTSASLDTSVCEGNLPLTWHGQRFTGTSTQTITIRNSHNADSVITLKLTAKRNSTSISRDTVVENRLPVIFAGLTFTSSQRDTTLRRTNAVGCDSLIRYSLHVYNNVSVTLDRTICENELPLSWNGQTFSSEGNKSKTLVGSHGQDSIILMRLHVLHNSRYTRHDTVVQNSLPVSFAGLQFSRRQNDTLIVRTNSVGCDSLITYSLHVWQNVSATADSTICENSLPLSWNNQTFTNSTNRTITLRTSHGADSLLTMRLKVLRNSTYTRRDTVVQNNLPIHFAGLTFSQAQSDTLIRRTNVAGCDSLINYSLFVHDNVGVMLDSTVCEGALPLTWNGHQFNNESIASKTFAGSHGEDSVVYMRLHVLRNTYRTYRDTVVENRLPVRFAGLSFARQQSDTILRRVNAVGCDSLIIYSLHVWRNVTATADSTICENSLPLRWNGYTFANEGSHTVTLRTTHGADSVLTMRLHVLRNSTYAQHDTVVENTLPVRFAGLSFSTRQSDTLIVRTNAVGCDSLITYSLHVYWNKTTTLDSTLCENNMPIVWNGRTFTTDGTQQVLLTGAHGEDSLVIMRMHVLRNTYRTYRDTTIENLLPIRFAGLNFYGQQLDTLLVRVNAAGCDSLITYSLHVWRNVTATADSTICENSLPLRWNGYSFADEGSHTVTLRTTHGADSVLTMRLHVLRNSTYAQHDTVVENTLPVRFAGLSFSTRQSDTLIHRTNAVGCDSLITYSLHVYWNQTITLDSSLCENFMPIVWNGRTFATDGTQQVMLNGSHGEDSLVIMRMHVLRNTYRTFRDTTVENLLPINFADLYFYEQQSDTLIVRVNAAGCDSLITYSLHVWGNVTASADSTICENSLPLVWNDYTFADEGSHTVTLRTTNRADSVLTMNLHVLRNSTYAQHDTIVENSLPVRFAGLSFSTCQSDTLILRTNAVGCDSLITYSLHVYWNQTTTLDSSLCENYMPIVWNGRTFTTDGTQQVMLNGSHGEDSLVIMRMHVLRNTYRTFRDTTVENLLPISFAYLYFYEQQSDTLIVRVNAAGCDSLITYSLHVWGNVTASADSTICENSLPLRWNGYTFSDEGSHTVTLRTTNGADSVLTMNLHVLRNSTYVQHDTVVENALPVRFAGLRFFISQRDTLLLRTNAVGCDSLITYSLHVYWNQYTRFDTSVCDNFMPLVWRDSLFIASDVKSTLLEASTGADSIVTLTLVVYPTYDMTVDASICYADYYTVGAKRFHLPGFYDVPLVSTHRCDSMVHLFLTVYETFYHTEYDTICDNRSQYFDGGYYHKEGTYVINHYTTDGCDSVMTLHLATLPSYNDTDDIIICYGGSYEWIDDSVYSEPTDQPNVHFFAVNGCDSVRNLVLRIDDPVVADYKLSPDIVTAEGQEVQLADRSLNSITRTWTVGGRSYGTSPQISFPYPSDVDTLRVVLAVSSNLGCTDTARFIVSYDGARFWAPSVITPELPSNNYFFIATCALASFECRIYNRQGLLVYQTSDPSFHWNGTHGGSACPQGAYVYTVRYTTIAQPLNNHTITGSVLIVR